MELPCKECGGRCCTPPAMNKGDAERIMKYTEINVEELMPNFWMLVGSWQEKNISPMCPAYDAVEKLCTIYKFRPTVCRKYAVDKKMPCCYLYPEKAEQFTKAAAMRVAKKRK